MNTMVDQMRECISRRDNSDLKLVNYQYVQFFFHDFEYKNICQVYLKPYVTNRRQQMG